ncbi:MAPEG family protein [Glaciecola siphonariae]|uniref:MAPEG family protein n=1 Tax=Glaciecola siphonariae TaxID=521012 RepID=A0ABV9LY16_9ALTE
MNTTIIALLGYISWVMVLLLALAVYRSVYKQQQKRDSLIFEADGNDIGGLGQRLTRAHLNCVECFPFIGGLLLFALATDSSAITNGLALLVLAARVGQSIVHAISVSNAAIILRFVFFLVQFAICIFWAFKFLQKFL